MQQQWIRTMVVAGVLAAASAAAPAQTRGEVARQAESTLLVDGYIVIAPDGSTAGVEIRKPEAFPPAVIDFVTTTVKGWKFKPVEHEGRIVQARAPMTVRLVAKKLDGDSAEISVRSASFGDEKAQAGIKPITMRPPSFPKALVRSGVGGTVFLALRLDASGKVIDVIPEQTNLRVVAGGREMETYRRGLERASVDAAKKWTYQVPQPNAEGAADSYTIRVPINYSFGADGGPRPSHGAWETYIPGPRNPIPWVSREDMLAGSAGGADAVGDGAVQQLGRGPQLLTPLGPG